MFTYFFEHSTFIIRHFYKTRTTQSTTHFNPHCLFYLLMSDNQENWKNILGTNQSYQISNLGNVKGKTCIIVDDIIDSGGTIVNAAQALKERGAKDVYVYITHGVLSGDAVEKNKKSVIKKLIITDTIDNHERVNKTNNIEVLSISNLMAEAIKRISNSTSVSDLFK